jgi:hypothetical protein
MSSEFSYSLLTISEILNAVRPHISLPFSLTRNKRALLEAINNMNDRSREALNIALTRKLARRVGSSANPLSVSMRFTPTSTLLMINEFKHSPYDVFTHVELLSILRPLVNLPSHALRTKRALLAIIPSLPVIAHEALSDALIQRAESINSSNDNAASALDTRDAEGNFLRPPSDSVTKNCLRSFYLATSNEQLVLRTCAVCAREHLITEEPVAFYNYSTIPNTDRLRPAVAHVAQTLLNGCILLESACSRDPDPLIPICDQCYKSLQNPSNGPPAFSLANNLWIGPMPVELQALTLPEQLLISRIYPRVFIVKLRPKKHAGGDPNTMQSGLRGNVTSFAMNTDKICSMVSGSLMPQNPSVLASLITIAYIGSGALPKMWLTHAFKVRRQRIVDALLWLKANNRHYSDIVIDTAQLNFIPEDDVPVELLATVRQETDETMANTEGASYVPVNSDDQDFHESFGEY